MLSNFGRALALVSAVLLLTGAGPQRGGPAIVEASTVLGNDPRDWAMVGRTYDEQRYSPLAQINDKTVGRLGLAWYADIQTERGMEASPLELGGVLYNVQPWNIVTAYDATNGKVLWRYDPQVPTKYGRMACCDIVSRGLAAAGGKIYVATLDGRLIALDAKSGKPLWSVLTVDNSKNYTITGAPRVYDGKVLIGNGGAEMGVRGYVTAYDAETGKQAWRFYTVPGNPADGFDKAMAMAAKTWTGEWWKAGGGGTVWDSMSYDPELRLVYIGVGNGSPWAQVFRSPGGGDNLFLASIVALNVDTGKYVWHYQTTPGEEWDYTATQQMILADIKIGGKLRKVIMQAPKNGFFYVLDRQTGELLSAKATVPINWATGVDMKTGRPIENPAVRYGKVPVMVSPGAGGAHNFNPMAFSPRTGLVYVPVSETYMAYAAADSFDPARPGLGTSFSGYDAERRTIAEYADAHSRGWLSARDPATQKEIWRTPMSRRVAAGSWRRPATWCSRATSARPSPPIARTRARRSGRCPCSKCRSPRRSATWSAACNTSRSTPAGAGGSRTSSARTMPSCSSASRACWCSSSVELRSCRRCRRNRSRCRSWRRRRSSPPAPMSLPRASSFTARIVRCATASPRVAGSRTCAICRRRRMAISSPSCWAASALRMAWPASPMC
jgi:quinohemoprotein ethanol dehydrogenase